LNANLKDGTDFVTGGVALMPGPGWIAAGAYFLINAGAEYYTGKSAGYYIGQGAHNVGKSMEKNPFIYYMNTYLGN
jgi:hypothetical protein